MKAPWTLGRQRWLCSTDRCGAQSKGWDAEATEATAWTKLVEGPTARSALYKRMNAILQENLTTHFHDTTTTLAQSLLGTPVGRFSVQDSTGTVVGAHHTGGPLPCCHSS